MLLKRVMQKRFSSILQQRMGSSGEDKTKVSVSVSTFSGFGTNTTFITKNGLKNIEFSLNQSLRNHYPNF